MEALTVVLGASPHADRYSYMAVEQLLRQGHRVLPVGIRRRDAVHGLPIVGEIPADAAVDTITLYIAPWRQPEWEQAMFACHPRRIIFNPGTENPALAARARAQGIEVVEGCTLVMLSVGTY